MKIAVCGCSFSATVKKGHEGTHWSEIIAKEMGAELLNYARQGVSNNVIRLQINEAIWAKADFVFINATTQDRIEYPVHVKDDTSKTVKGEDRGYYPDRGLANFNYNRGPYTMVSETMFSVIDWRRHPYRLRPVDPEVMEAVKEHTAWLYDENWKKQCDLWMMAGGLWKLHDLGIPFIYNPWLICFPHTVKHPGEDMMDLPEWFRKKHVAPWSLNFNQLRHDYPAEGADDPGYHTTHEGQQWLAQRYIELMKERN